MSDFYTKQISLSDIPFFMSECEDSARNGHLHQELLIGEHEKAWGNSELCCHRGYLTSVQAFHRVTRIPT